MVIPVGVERRVCGDQMYRVGVDTAHDSQAIFMEDSTVLEVRFRHL